MREYDRRKSLQKVTKDLQVAWIIHMLKSSTESMAKVLPQEDDISVYEDGLLHGREYVWHKQFLHCTHPRYGPCVALFYMVDEFKVNKVPLPGETRRCA